MMLMFKSVLRSEQRREVKILLRRQGSYSEELPPALVLSGLFLREKSGHEVLPEVVEDNKLQIIIRSDSLKFRSDGG